MKIIDLSKPIQYNKSDPWFMKVKIKHKPHRKAKWLIRFLGLPFRLFPKNFIGWADDTIKNMGVHATTHIDAPWHYSPTTNGQKSKTIDEVPLEWCYGQGLVIDMKHKADFDPITRNDIEDFLSKNKLTIKPKMIVLIKTGRDKFNGTKNFHEIGTGMSAEATEWLIDKGIKSMQQKMQNQQGQNQPSRPEGEVTIEKKQSNKAKSSQNKDDYVDFEEVD